MYIFKKVSLSILILCLTIVGFSQISVIDTIHFGSITENGFIPVALDVNPKTNRIYVANGWGRYDN